MNGKNVFNWIRMLLVILLLVFSIVIMLYPFPNRNLNIQIETEDNIYELDFSSADIENFEYVLLSLDGIECVVIKEVRFYGAVRSISLMNLSYSDLANYVEGVPGGTMLWKENGLQFTGQKQIQVMLNEDGTEMVKSLSASFLLERFCIWEGFIVLFSLLFTLSILMEEKISKLGYNNHGAAYEVKKFITDIKKYSYYMVYAAQTDLKAEVANSYLNRLWWLLEPFFNMLVYVIVFGKVMGRTIENYATFVFSALLMWNFFSKTISYSVKLVRNNKDIVTKVYVPKFVLLLSNMFLNMFKLLFSMIVLVIMLFVFKIHISIEILWVIPAYIILILLGFGMGMIFLHYGVYVDDLSYAVGILLNMLMFLSGIFYDLMSTLSEPLCTIMLCFNPIAMVVDTMRNALLYNRIVNVPLLVIWLLISLILSCIGVHIVYKNENAYVKVV
ncbi:teichoic acid translocation permease protein TagG [Lachnospiraceae bacterium]|nr:teichoic acid translocation permease protein TagG [Lachnospiraceae bacterium]